MKIVIQHRMTGRYYCSYGRWVRRADNALTFDDLRAAREFSRRNHLDYAEPVTRFAPYMAALLRGNRLEAAPWRRQEALWSAVRLNRFACN